MSWKPFAIAVIALGIIASAYFGVTTYKAMAEENASLKGQVTQLEADKKAMAAAQALISQTVSRNETNTTRIIERTREIEGAINASPKSTDCINAPAIRALLDGLRDNEQQSKATLP